MSAYLDRSQGVTFVFSNIFELYQKAKNAKLDEPFLVEPPRVYKQGAINPSVKVTAYQEKNIETDAKRTFAVPMGVREAEDKARALSAQLGSAGIRKNIDELKEAQQRLRFLLQEIEAMSKKNT